MVDYDLTSCSAHDSNTLVREKKKKNYPCNRTLRPMGVWEVEALTFSRQSAHMWR
jgi:hypothetical protein